MTESPLMIKSKEFALTVIKVCKELRNAKCESALINQFLRLGTSITDFKKSRTKTYVLWNYNRHFGNINSAGCYLVYGIDVNYIPLKLTLDFKLESKILQLFKIVLTNSKIVIQYLSKLNIFLIKSGGGTRPVEARQPVFQGAKSVGLTER